MKLLLGLFVLLAAQTTFGFDQSYLEAGNNFYEEVNGNGYEAGFEFKVEVYGVVTKEGIQKVKRPIVKVQYDSADCMDGVFVSAKPVSKKLLFVGRGGSETHYKFSYQVQIDTIVNADTGGCLARIYSDTTEQADLLKVVEYNYVTNY